MSVRKKDKIKVLQVLEATTGGTRRHLLDLVRELDPGRFEVSIVCATGRDPEFIKDIQYMRDAGHRVDVLPMVRPIRPFNDLRNLFRICGILRENPVDIVHTHSAKAGILGRTAAKLVGGLKIVHTPHHFPFDMEVNRYARQFYFRIEKIAGRVTDRIVCVCKRERESALKRRLAPPEKLVVIENGIHAEEAKAAPRTIQRRRRELDLEPEHIAIGVVGRFTRQKGQIFLLDAAPEILRRVPNAYFIFIGGGEDYPQLVQRAAHNDVSDRCRFVEQRLDIAAFYGALDLLVMPSLWEGLPYTLLETMAAGTPVAAFETGGIMDVIRHNHNGLLVPRKDTEALADTVCRAALDQNLRDDLAAAARETVGQNHDIAQMITETEQMYEELAVWRT